MDSRAGDDIAGRVADGHRGRAAGRAVQVLTFPPGPWYTRCRCLPVLPPEIGVMPEKIKCSEARGRAARRTFCGWAFTLFLTGALPGCALYSTYEKCGFRGCPGDAKITADVMIQLNRCSFLEPNAIRVQTWDHVVYLNGGVVSGLEIGTAESIARQVPGVARVVNSITLSER